MNICMSLRFWFGGRFWGRDRRCWFGWRGSLGWCFLGGCVWFGRSHPSRRLFGLVVARSWRLGCEGLWRCLCVWLLWRGQLGKLKTLLSFRRLEGSFACLLGGFLRGFLGNFWVVFVCFFSLFLLRRWLRWIWVWFLEGWYGGPFCKRF